jgi:hypothetical protein
MTSCRRDEDAEDYDDDEAKDSEERRCRLLRRQGADEDACRPWSSTLILLIACSSIREKKPGNKNIRQGLYMTR